MLPFHREGEEVTISYGGHPDAVFYLFFGFLPTSNPSNLIVMSSIDSKIAPLLSSFGIQQYLDDYPGNVVRCSICSPALHLIPTCFRINWAGC